MVSAMPHIEQKASLPRFDDGSVNFATVIQNALRFTVQKMTHDISGFQYFEHLCQRNRRIGYMHHYGKASGKGGRAFCQAKRFDVVVADHFNLLPHFDADDAFRMRFGHFCSSLGIVQVEIGRFADINVGNTDGRNMKKYPKAGFSLIDQ